jgi:hypothetical protein
MSNKIIIFLILAFNTIQVFAGLSVGPIKTYLQVAIEKCDFKKIEHQLKYNNYCEKYQGFLWVKDAKIEKKINIDQARDICVLLKKYLDINCCFDTGTVLSKAIQANDIELVKLFIDMGANVNQDYYNYYQRITPLILATTIKCPKIVQCLIKAGAELDEKDNNGDTALIIAASKNHSLIVYLLLINGADTTIVNNSGLTFFHYIQDNPILIKLYKEINEVKSKIIHETISKRNGFNQDMPAELVDMIHEY